MNDLVRLAYARTDQWDHEGAEALLNSWMDTPAFALAYHLLEQGFSVIPLCTTNKRPARRWKRYQTALATVADLIEWFCDNDYSPAVVTGALSGITIIDCDSPEAAAVATLSGLASRMTQQTKRGVHFVFRHSGERNTVRVDGMDDVDRRGEGGYVKAYPECGEWTRGDVQSAGLLEGVK